MGAWGRFAQGWHGNLILAYEERPRPVTLALPLAVSSLFQSDGLLRTRDLLFAKRNA